MVYYAKSGTKHRGPLHYTASDGNGGTDVATVTVTVISVNDPPVITAPAPFTTETTAVDTPLTSLDYGIAIVTDDTDPSPTVVSNSTGVFPLGDTVLLWTATDNNGLTDTATQTVTITDTTLPIVTDPDDVTFEATAILSPLNETNYGTATDIFPIVSITSDAPDTFSLGKTEVHWTAVDANGNTFTTATQVITIQDTTPPQVITPEDIQITATSFVGTNVTYSDVSAIDAVGVTAGPTCDVASNSLFAITDTTVTCVAEDSSGNVGESSFTIIVNQATRQTQKSFTIDILDNLKTDVTSDKTTKYIDKAVKHIIKSQEDGKLVTH